MMAWIKANPLWAGIALVVLLALVWGGWNYLSDRAEKHDEQNVERGVQKERLESNEETFNAVQNANDAVRNPQPDELERMRERYDRSRSQDTP